MVSGGAIALWPPGLFGDDFVFGLFLINLLQAESVLTFFYLSS